LILILLNGHKISCPQQQLDTEALSQSETFCEEYSGDETFAWKSFEKKLSAYRFLKYLVQENDIHVDLPSLNTFLSFSETDTEKYVPVSMIWQNPA
jgi:hypothetical protein